MPRRPRSSLALILALVLLLLAGCGSGDDSSGGGSGGDDRSDEPAATTEAEDSGESPFEADAEDPESVDDYGTDDALDQLTDDCADGDFAACDDLYGQSDLGSDYETYGSTCGGRSEDRLDGNCERDAGFADVDLSGDAEDPEDSIEAYGTDDEFDELA